MALPPFEELLARSIEAHGGHACPGQVLGVRLALVGLREIGIEAPHQQRKQFLVYVEIDRCATDAIQAVTGCRVGKRSLKIVDYGILAATFVRLDRDLAVRVVARDDARERVPEYTRLESSHYERQADAYQRMPEELLFDIQRVKVTVPEEDLPGPPLSRVGCQACGESVQDRREIRIGGLVLCRACAGAAYYDRPPVGSAAPDLTERSRCEADLVHWTPAGVPVLGIAGASGAGKTTVLAELVSRLTARRLRVGVLKHSCHELSLDHPGKDTDRLYAAGAAAVYARGTTQGFARRRLAEPADWLQSIADVSPDIDLLLVEGHKQAPWARIWVESGDDRAFGEAPGIIARLASGPNALDEADRAVSAWLNQTWAARPWGLLVADQHSSSVEVAFALGEDVAAFGRAELTDRTVGRLDGLRFRSLPIVPGLPRPLAAVMAAMRWQPERAWLVAPSADLDRHWALIAQLLGARRPGVWAQSLPVPHEGREAVSSVEPQLRPRVERLAARGLSEAHGTTESLWWSSLLEPHDAPSPVRI